MNRRERSIYKRVFRRDWRPAEPIVSLSEAPRTRWSEDGEHCDEYGFLFYEGEATDQEISEWLDEHITRRVSWPVQWDCSGQLFTWDMHWKRLGDDCISYINRMCLDV